MIALVLAVTSCTPNVTLFADDTPESRLQVYSVKPDACFPWKWRPTKSGPVWVDKRPRWLASMNGPATYRELPIVRSGAVRVRPNSGVVSSVLSVVTYIFGSRVRSWWFQFLEVFNH